MHYKDYAYYFVRHFCPQNCFLLHYFTSLRKNESNSTIDSESLMKYLQYSFANFPLLSKSTFISWDSYMVFCKRTSACSTYYLIGSLDLEDNPV